MKTGRKPKDKWTRFVTDFANEDAPLSAATLKALKRHGVSEEQLRRSGKITPILEQAEGGLKQVIAAMRLASDGPIRQFLERYDTISATELRHMPIEAIALAAGVNIEALLGSIMFALHAQAFNVSQIIALTAHPKITAARMRYAQQPAGHRDRAALDTVIGLLPPPKSGPTVIAQAIFGSGKSVMDAQRRERVIEGGLEHEEEDEPPIACEFDYDLDRLFPPASKMQEKLVAIRQRILPVADPDKKTPIQ